jgi:selenide,water dikinase
MPIVDDPYDFGRIAATNAISDVYAMGGTPIMALALVGMPIDKLPVEVIRRILDGGESICAKRAFRLQAGTRSTRSSRSTGLVVMGLVPSDKIKTNRGARAGDVLILGKPLGVGVLSAAVKKNKIDASGYRELIASTTKLNTPGRLLRDLSGRSRDDGRHRVRPARPPVADVPGGELCARRLRESYSIAASRRGDGRRRVRHRASARNWASYGNEVRAWRRRHTFAEGSVDRSADERRPPRCVRCRNADEVLSIFRSESFDRATVIGELREGPAKVEVT